MKKSDLLNFVRQHDLAVVSTVAKNKPQSAVVEFGELEDLTIIIDTLKTSRKYANLQKNNKVSLVIGWDDNKTLQMDAKASELKGSNLKNAKIAYFSKNSRAKKWANKPEIAYFALKPYWVRYSDVGRKPWQIEEFSF